MIIFEWNKQERKDYENWMMYTRDQIKDNILAKSLLWSYNFTTDESQDSHKYEWEEPVTVCPRQSSIRTTLSTLPTLCEEETLEEIPSISETDLRLTLELLKTPIIILPHRSLVTMNRPSEYLISKERCCACLDYFNETDKVIPNPCGHKFHYTCMQTWVRSLPECEYCRNELRGL